MIDPDLDEVRRLAMGLAAQVHARSGDTDSINQRLVATADAITNWLTTDPAQVALEQRIQQLEEQMTSMQGRMDDTAAAIADLNVATDELAARIDAVIDTADAQTAAALQPIADRLRTLASDATQPVPPEEPTPEPGV